MEQYPSDNFIPQREPNEVTLEYVAEPKPYVAYYVPVSYTHLRAHET